MMRTIRLAALACAVAAVAAPGQTIEDPRTVLVESAKAMREVSGVTFRARETATGMLKGFIDFEGEVKLWRPEGAPTPTWRVDGRAKMPGLPDAQIHVVCDGVTVQWLSTGSSRQATHTKFTRPATDPLAAEILSLSKSLLPTAWLAPEPFAEELALTNLSGFRVTTPGGELWDVILARTADGARSRTWAISARDHLPRFVELATVGEPSVAVRTDMTPLRVVTLTARDFELPLPPGFVEDRLQYALPSPATVAAEPAAIAPPVAAPMVSAPVARNADRTDPVVLPKGIAVVTPAPVPIARPNPAPPISRHSASSPAAARQAIVARFTATETELPLDPTRPVRVIPVSVPDPSSTDRLFHATCDHLNVLAIERPAAVLANNSLGYLLVRPLAKGTASITVGDSRITVRVVDQPARDMGAFGPSPQLIAPLSGAAVWGKIRVGVCFWRLPGESHSGASIRLRVGEGPRAQVIEPAWTSKPEDGPLALASFPVDFDGLPLGSCALQPLRTDAAGAVHTGPATTVQVVTLDEADIAQGECEEYYGVFIKDRYGLDRTGHGPPAPLPSAPDRAASGGRFLNNAGADPRFRYPITVPEGGAWYQVMLTAAGDAAAGALPSIGITIDEAERPATCSSIAQPTWHRTPIGTPIHLSAGPHVIRCDFVNDFNSRPCDRNLRLDRIELARVGSSEPSDASRRSEGADSAMMSMQGSPMQPSSMQPHEPPMGGEMAMQPMAPSSAPTHSASWPALTRAALAPPVRVAFERPIDGLTTAGEVEFRAVVSWDNQRSTPPPQVSLVLNGAEVQRHRSDAPRFVLPIGAFRAGENTVQLRALADSGFIAETAVQRITRHEQAETTLSGAASHRFTIHDPVWSPELVGSLKDNQGGTQRKSAPLAHGAPFTLTLPEDLSGEFDLYLESRSNGRNERKVEVSVLTPAPAPAPSPDLASAVLLSRPIPTYFDPHRFTTNDSLLSLPYGPKQLRITVTSSPRPRDDKQAVWLQAVRLVQRTPEALDPPTVALVYPDLNQHVFGADALVADIRADLSLDWAEPVIDGAPTGLRYDLRRQGGLGRVLVPLSLRSLEQGWHSIALRVSDLRGQVTQSSTRSIRVVPVAPRAGTIYERAVTLLDRFAYGPDPRELADLLALGPDRYLASRLTDDAAECAEDDLARVRFPNARSVTDVTRRAIQQAIATSNPVRNRFTLWAENHFSTWVRKDEAWRKWDEHERFAALGIPRFHDLLFTSATSPAMLRYLDQERSYSNRLNENYARELMELHTLGVHGGYTQQDVTNLAHVLTGWTTARCAPRAGSAAGALGMDATPDEDGLVEYFQYEPSLASTLREPREVLGFRFGEEPRQDRHQRVLLALEVLAAHPSTARYVCTKLAAHCTSVTPPPELIDELASTFTRTGGDMRQVLLALAQHPAFWEAAKTKRLAHPTDYAFRLARTSSWTGWQNPYEIADFLASSGHLVFDRPTPDGYPEEDSEAMDSNAMLQRWKLAGKADAALADAVPPHLRWGGEALTPALRQAVIDIIAIRLTGRLLGEESNALALDILEQAQPQLPPRPDELNHDAQIRTIATFIAQLPEANTR